MANWRENTNYIGCDASTPLVTWFWEIVGDMTTQDRVLLVQFVTGSSRVPSGGFANLMGSSGPTKFTLSKIAGSALRLPTASVCYNFLKLPEYTSKEQLAAALTMALRLGTVGFEFT